MEAQLRRRRKESKMTTRAWGRLLLDLRGVREIARAMPAGGWVAIIVGLSWLMWALYGTGIGAPHVFNDELIHGSLARSIADGHLPRVRGDVVWGYGIVSPLLDAIPLRLGGDMDHGYALLKIMNSLVMSLAAIPAYLLGRRLLRPVGAVLVAALTVAVPSMVFTALVMTESVFYPLFLILVLVIVRALERPSVGRQACVLTGLALAYLTRPQGLVILPAYLCAIALAAWFERRAGGAASLRTVWGQYRATFVVIGLALVVGIGGTLARGVSPARLLGAYTVLATSYSPLETIYWSLINLADLELYVGVVALAGFVLGVAPAFERRGATAATRTYAAVAVPVVVLFILAVGAFATTQYGGAGVHDRNSFYVVPLLLIGLVAWIERGLPNPRRLTLVVILLVGVLPTLIPLGDVRYGAWVNQIGLQVWLAGFASVMPAWAAKLLLIAAVVAGAALVLGTPVRWRWLLIGVVGMTFFINGAAARWQGNNGGASAAPNPVWIDEAVGRDATVTALFVDPPRCTPLDVTEERWIRFWRSEFFNRSVLAPISIGSPLPGTSALPGARVVPGGDVLLGNDTELTASYLLLDSRIGLERGTIVARSPSQRLALWEVGGPVTLRPTSLRGMCSDDRAASASN